MAVGVKVSVFLQNEHSVSLRNAASFSLPFSLHMCFNSNLGEEGRFPLGMRGV